MSIKESVLKIRNQLPKGATLVAVSKTKPNRDILEAYETGQRDFGENKVQEVCEKYTTLPKDIKWHFIGHLQTNKVKMIVPFITLIHGVDSLKLLQEINKRAGNINRVVDCLLQLSIADEETKFGFSDEELRDLLKWDILNELRFVNIRGLMGMATFTENENKIRMEFRHLKEMHEFMAMKINKPDFNIISMGMTGDYKIALEEGSNTVRIGSLIFGERA